jgi:hypothetical protein
MNIDEMEAPQQKKTLKPIAAGILLLAIGIYGLIRGLIKLITDIYIIPSVYGLLGFEVAGIILVIMGAMCLVGALFSFRRDLWDVAFAGAVFGLFSSWPLAIVTMVLLARSKDELL